MVKLLVLIVLGWPGVCLAAQAPAVADLYVEHCAVCHGENGDGKSRARYGLNPPPRDFTAAAAWEELTPERMRGSIRFGRPGTGMVAWDKKLSGEQIDALVDYIRNRFMRAPTTQAHPQGHRQEQVPAADSNPGARLYKKHCAACHGDRGSGAQWTQYSLNPPPRDFTAAMSGDELNRERMLTSVTFGRPGTAMMSFEQRLSAEQIVQVVDYIRHDFMQIKDEAPPTPPADMSLAFPHDLIGDIEHGRVFYHENCFTCHGVQGLGDGPRSRFINPRPRNFVAATSRRYLNRPNLFLAISRGKPGTVMPAWSTVLTDQQVADVAEYVFQSFILGTNQRGSTGQEKKKVLN
jgi:mono/diheme cytochrome c family protein